MSWAKRMWEKGLAEAAAFGRQGAHELTQALPAFPTTNVRPIEEPGLWGNPTPAQVDREANPEAGPAAGKPDFAEWQGKQAEAANDRPPGKDRGMEMG